MIVTRRGEHLRGMPIGDKHAQWQQSCAQDSGILGDKSTASQNAPEPKILKVGLTVFFFNFMFCLQVTIRTTTAGRIYLCSTGQGNAILIHLRLMVIRVLAGGVQTLELLPRSVSAPGAGPPLPPSQGDPCICQGCRLCVVCRRWGMCDVCAERGSLMPVRNIVTVLLHLLHMIQLVLRRRLEISCMMRSCGPPYRAGKARHRVWKCDGRCGFPSYTVCIV